MITLDLTATKKNGCRRRKVYYYSHDSEANSFRPMIRLQGKHLKSYGFNIGDIIEVYFEQNNITIKKVICD